MNPSPSRPESFGSSRRIARVLDSLFKIPGSTLRIGLDPIIGLVPGVGDALASAMGSIILLEAVRAGAPRLLVLRMTGNLLINAGVGAIPIAGDLFSMWFRSNAKNYALLRAWQTGDPKSISHGKWVITGFVVLLLIMGGFVVLACWLFTALWRWITG